LRPVYCNGSLGTVNPDCSGCKGAKYIAHWQGTGRSWCSELCATVEVGKRLVEEKLKLVVPK